MITELCRQQTEQCTVKRAHCKCAWKQLWQDYSAVSIFSPWRVCNRNICVWYCHTVSWVKVRITDRHRQPSVCKSPAQRKSLWNTGIWKNEHNRLWLSGCVTMWLHDRVAVRLSVSRRGGCLKAKTVYDRRIITLHFSMLQPLGSWLLHFVENVKWRHLIYYLKHSLIIERMYLN